MINAEVAHAAGAELGEGCVWSPTEELLVWVDIDGWTVHRFDHRTGRPVSAVGYGDQVGNAEPRAGGGLVLGLGRSVALTGPGGEIEAAVELPGEPESNRANDGAVDPAGRLFQGTMPKDLVTGTGSLYRFDPDRSVRRVVEGVQISNGIDWSLDGQTMYYIDTLTYRVDAFDYDLATGEISGRRPFLTFDGSTGGPDGMTIDAEGCLWVVFFGGYCVQRFSPDGERLEAVATPGAPNPTCCCFGGPGLDALYITTARHRMTDEQLETEANAGALFVADVDAVGRPANLFAG